MPSIKDLSYGMRRRTHVIPFRVQFGQENQDQTNDVIYRTANPAVFLKIWDEEMPGVLVLAVRGLQRLFKRGAFDQPAACIDAGNKWLAEANPLVTFISEECECSVDVRQTATQFFTAYKFWRFEQGFGYHAVTQSKVTRNLGALGYRVTKSNGERWVHGIRAPGTIGTFPAESISMVKT
jgi:phage/plasmid-associated DNA primase